MDGHQFRWLYLCSFISCGNTSPAGNTISTVGWYCHSTDMHGSDRECCTWRTAIDRYMDTDQATGYGNNTRIRIINNYIRPFIRDL